MSVLPAARFVCEILFFGGAFWCGPAVRALRPIQARAAEAAWDLVKFSPECLPCTGRVALPGPPPRCRRRPPALALAVAVAVAVALAVAAALSPAAE